MPSNCFRAQYGQVPMFAMERSATCMFGLRQYGVDVNGYIKDANGQISIWMQKRSTTKPTWPGRWDNFVSLLIILQNNWLGYRILERFCSS